MPFPNRLWHRLMGRGIVHPVDAMDTEPWNEDLLDHRAVRDMMIEGVPGSTAKDQSRAKSDTLEEPKHYGLHRHFTGGSSVVMFGGGMKKGHIHGATADERPLVAVKDPVTISNLHATIFTAMDISPQTVYQIEKRPFYATEDGKGRAVDSLFA